MSKEEKFWDRTASSYDKEEKKDGKKYSYLIEKTRTYLKASDVVLDYGSGTGLISTEIAGDASLIHGIDISSRMISIAQKKAAKRAITNIEYTQAPLFDPRFQSGSYDVILAFYILHLLEDVDKSMRRIHELLKPEGLFISATPCTGDRKSFKGGLISVLGMLGVVPNIRAFKADELKAVITRGNFEIVEMEDMQEQQHFIVARKI